MRLTPRAARGRLAGDLRRCASWSAFAAAQPGHPCPVVRRRAAHPASRGRPVICLRGKSRSTYTSRPCFARSVRDPSDIYLAARVEDLIQCALAMFNATSRWLLIFRNCDSDGVVATELRLRWVVASWPVHVGRLFQLPSRCGLQGAPAKTQAERSRRRRPWVLMGQYTYLRKGWVYHDGSSIHPKVVPPVCDTANFERRDLLFVSRLSRNYADTRNRCPVGFDCRVRSTVARTRCGPDGPDLGSRQPELSEEGLSSCKSEWATAVLPVGNGQRHAFSEHSM
jgi:hypothetical protein